MELSVADVQKNKNSVSSLSNDKYAGPSVRCVLFDLNSETYGINVKKIREVLRVVTIRKVEGSDERVLGVINVRGVIVTVVDTRTSYGIARRAADDYSRIIIVELDADNIVGMLVDSVQEVKDIPEKNFEPIGLTANCASKYIQAIAHFQDRVIILIDVDNMFGVEN